MVNIFDGESRISLVGLLMVSVVRGLEFKNTFSFSDQC